MYLIILLGVVSKLALVSGQCYLGDPKLENVDWNELTGKWYWLYHTSNKVEDNFDCVRTIYAFSLNGISVFNTVYNKRKQRKVTFDREASNIRTNGYFNIFTAKFSAKIWTGRYLLLAIERNSYIIMAYCSKLRGNRKAFIGFRNLSPDEATLEKAFKAFNETDLDASQLVKWSADHCY